MHLLLFLLLPLAGCTAERSMGPCVEGFCLPADAQLLSSEAPVEDFNIYRVAWRGAQFGIYEGNHPRASNDRTPVRLPVGKSASLSVSNGRGTLIVGTGNGLACILGRDGSVSVVQRLPFTRICQGLAITKLMSAYHPLGTLALWLGYENA